MSKTIKKNGYVPGLRDTAQQIWLAGLGAFALAGEEGGKLFGTLVERGGRALSAGVEEVQHRVGGLVRSSAKRLPPVRRARSELDLLRQGLAALDRSLSHLEAPVLRPVRSRGNNRTGGGATRAPRRRAHS